jgi:deoxyribose-phosphate aldolase
MGFLMATRPETRAALAAMIDHTLLRPEATAADVLQLCTEAEELGVAAVCVSPSRLPVPSMRAGIAVASVVGFPSGAHAPETKAAEAALAVDNGATEIDMVIDLGLAAVGDWTSVEQEIRVVRDAIDADVVLKVILESGLLDDDRLVAACQASERAGADFVKTSTGFHPSGGATVHAIEVMAATVGGRLGIKASGGIRSTEDALSMIDAGATRIGASRSADIVAGLPAS